MSNTGTSIAELRQMLRYDPETGEIISLETGCRTMETARRDGYFCGRILGKVLLTHRVAFALYHGRWPEPQVDHINGDRADNRITNLREVTNRQNARNAKLHTRNTSGITGVSWDRSRQKWIAYINTDKGRVHLGRFERKASAVAARAEAERREGYAEKHGRATDV